MKPIVAAAIGALLLAAPAAAAGRLSAADRAAINRTFDVFVPSAVARKNVAASYDLATPQLRGGLTRRQWATGALPVYPFSARGTTFHEWTVTYVDGNEVGFELMLRPRNLRQDSLYYDGAVKKIHGRWLVDGITPAAAFSSSGAPKVVGPHDFLPSGGGGNAERHLSEGWITLPFVLIGLAFVLGIAFALVGWLRGRAPKPSDAEQARYDEFAARVRARR
jgi:hypothetical protein